MPVRRHLKPICLVSHYSSSQSEDNEGSLTRLAGLAAYARRDCLCSVHDDVGLKCIIFCCSVASHGAAV